MPVAKTSKSDPSGLARSTAPWFGYDQRRPDCRRQAAGDVRGERVDRAAARDRSARQPDIEGTKVDRAYRIPDQTGLTIVYQLLREEGLFLGLSSGINVAGAVRFAKESGPGQTIVTILCDSGHKYQSTLFNRDWLASNHLDPELPLESIVDR